VSRAARLDNRPQAERDTLMKQIADAEGKHFQGRNRCLEHLRKMLSAEVFSQLTKL